MRRARRLLPILGVCSAAVWLLYAAEERLARARNIGKAYYETPAGQERAVAEFRRALDLAPDSARERVNYGLALLRAGRTREGVAELERAQKQDPAIPHTWFNLGIAYKKDGQAERALAQFAQFLKLAQDDAIGHYQYAAASKLLGNTAEAIEHFARAAQLNGTLAAPHFQLYNLHRTAGRTQDAERELKAFQALKAARPTEDVDWNAYAEIYELIEPSRDAYASPTGLTVEADFDNDGAPERCVTGPREAAIERGGKRLHVFPGTYSACIWIDYDHDYDLDLMLLGREPALYRNNGAAVPTREAFPFVPGEAAAGVVFDVHPDTDAFDLLVAYADRTAVLYRDLLLGNYKPVELPFRLEGPLRAADIDHDSWTDIVAGPRALYNRQGDLRPGPAPVVREPGVNWLRVVLEGVKNAKLAYGAKVEVRAANIYRKQWYYGAPVTFDLAAETEADTVRVTWPNGLVQNEIRPLVRKEVRIKEAPRMMGSCPNIYAWNGRGFEFITDTLGVAPLGANQGKLPIDSDEHILIPGESLVSTQGSYEIRIREELREVTYLDHVNLMAVDHPAGTEIFTNEKVASQPVEKLQIYVARDRRPLKTWRDGGNVYADLNGLPPDHTLLVATGAVDWPDGSRFRAAEQAGIAYGFPLLETAHAAGWRTAVEMGMPDGKSKTIITPLPEEARGKRIRIAGEEWVAWTQFSTAAPANAERRSYMMGPHAAMLRFSGHAPFDQTPGLYTRYGDVIELLERSDTKLAVFGSGDELQLIFSARNLPAIERGFQRDFILYVNGWAKDADPNTLHGRTVEPLPGNLQTLVHRRYNTRKALRASRSLAFP
jgi:tetratricopeptide (TPR) repeat protein